MSTAPTIGRIVHYVSYGSKDGRYDSTCRAAMVTESRPSGELGLCVMNPTGVFFDRQVSQSEGDHRGGTWHWPCVITPEEEEK